MQKYAKNMPLHRLQLKFNIANMQIICKKYAQYVTKICNKYAINMQNICIFCIYMHAPLC